jgi:hypothetical protein
MSTVYLITGLLGVFAAIFLALAALGSFTNEARGVAKSLAVLEAFCSNRRSRTGSSTRWSTAPCTWGGS